MKCIKGKEIAVHKFAAGFYIGCVDEEGPYCRISGHFTDKESAQTALDNLTFYRFAEEISFCNHGRECIPPQPPFIVSGEDRYEPGEIEEDFGDDLEGACVRAGCIRDDGGYAEVYDRFGREVG